MLSFGLNNRSDKVLTTSLPKYRLMARQAQLAFSSAKIHVVEPNLTESLPDNEKQNLENLLDGIRRTLKSWTKELGIKPDKFLLICEISCIWVQRSQFSAPKQ